MFVSFEGGEGAGKTTLIHTLYEELKSHGFSVLLTKAPGGTRLGEHIRHLLLSNEIQNMSPYAELFLFLADRAQHVTEVIQPALKSGQIVLCDRFNDSTIAYQGSARGFDLNKLQELCSMASQHLAPDLTLYLDIDPKIGLSRVQREKDRIEQETVEFHQKIRQAYLAIAKKNPNRFHVLDASRAPEEVYQDALNFFSPCWQSKS